MKTRNIALVTYDQLPNLDPDDGFLRSELERRGIACSAAIWDDPSVNWSRFDLCVIRSTWDYHLKYDQFLDWARRVAQESQLWNPLDLIVWNSKKSTYLQELGRKGAPIIPTAFVENGASNPLQKILADRGWDEAIIKPAIGLATYGVSRLNRNSAAAHEEKVRQLRNQGQTVLVQPFINSVTTYGERALIFIDGEYSHTVRKTAFQPMAVAGGAGERGIGSPPDEIETAKSVLQHCPQPPLYARIDLVRDDDDTPRLMELELVEPSLFIAMHPAAAVTFADAIERRL